MGLLDDFPYGLLNQIRNAARSQIPNAYSGTGDVNDLPSWTPRLPQRAPLSFAGPDLTADIAASSPDRPADFLRAQPPAPPAPNLTVQALRMKGVPEADISAAIGNPKLLNGLILQHYRPGPAEASVKIGDGPSGINAAAVCLVIPANVPIRKPTGSIWLTPIRFSSTVRLDCSLTRVTQKILPPNKARHPLRGLHHLSNWQEVAPNATALMPGVTKAEPMVPTDCTTLRAKTYAKAALLKL